MFIRLHRRGPALWPEVFGLAQLLRRRGEVGEEHFARAYQGEPVVGSAVVFRAELLRYYEALPRVTERWQAWDTAQGAGDGHDYSCCVTGGRGADGVVYVQDVWRGKLEAPALKAQIVALARRWTPQVVLIEEAASGPTLLGILRGERGVPVRGVKARDSKPRRAAGAAIRIAEGRVRLPVQAPWLETFREELLNFPTAAHDDQVDAFAHLVLGMLGQPPITMAELSRMRNPYG